MRPTIWSCLVILAVVRPAVAAAQTPADVAPAAESLVRTSSSHDRTGWIRALFGEVGRDLARLPSNDTLATLGLASAIAVAVHPADRPLTEGAAGSRALGRVFTVGEVAGGGWAHTAGAVAVFAAGTATDHGRVRDVGIDLVRAQILTAILTQGIKLPVNRTRPDRTRFSFPSGHSSGSFATATVLARHFGWKAGLPAYGFAAYVGASRLQENRHFASDVIFGAAIGIVTGRTVTIGHGDHRFVLAPAVVPGGVGVTVALAR